MSKHQRETEQELFIPAQLIQSPGNPFYQKLNKLFAEAGFDDFLEELCAPFYKIGGRPSITPGSYFRMLLVGYFEGISSERGICWRVADSLSLREFTGIGLTGRVPEHSSFTKIRARYDEGVYVEFFGWVLKLLEKEGLLKGRTLGIDSTMLQANASMKSLQRKTDQKSYEDYVKGLAEEKVENPDAQDTRRIDRKRKKKVSNKEWENPNDPDAKIGRMKNRTTRMSHKVEHAIDMETGALVGVEIYGGSEADTQTIDRTVQVAAGNIGEQPREVVADAGYHSNDVLSGFAEDDIRTYIAEPKRGKRKWKGRESAKRAVYANRVRRKRAKGKRLQRARGEKVERPFQVMYDRCGMKQCHLRGHNDIRKRLLIHGAAYNVGVLLRNLFGAGTPKGVAAQFRICFSQFALQSPPWAPVVFTRFLLNQQVRTIDKIGDLVHRVMRNLSLLKFSRFSPAC